MQTCHTMSMLYPTVINPVIYLIFQFEKPGRRDDFDYPDMAKEAGTCNFIFLV